MCHCLGGARRRQGLSRATLSSYQSRVQDNPVLTLPNFSPVELVAFRAHAAVSMGLLAVRVGVHFAILGPLISFSSLLILHLALNNIGLAKARTLDRVLAH